MIDILQILVSLIFFANKVYVLVGKKTGWLLGAIAASLATIYFFLIHLYIFTALEIGLVVLMGYAFLRGERKSEEVERALRITIVLVMSALAYFVFTGLMTIFEFVAAAAMLFGTYFLTHDRVRIGWGIYGLAHIFSTIVGYNAHQQFFADFQIASGIVAFVGMATTKRWLPS